jgi:transcriptional regulator
MHPNAAFRTDDETLLLARLAANPLATLSVTLDGRLLVAHAPLLARRVAEGLVFDFHLSRSNALASAIASGFHAVAVSLEADAYISPDWYAAADQVPTWNYVSVEAEGPVAALDDEGLVALLDDLSAQEEARLLPKTPWTRHKMSPGRFEAMTRAIVGARMTVERLEGTTKLSQNKSDADVAGVLAALGDHPIGRLMAPLLRRS